MIRFAVFAIALTMAAAGALLAQDSPANSPATLSPQAKAAAESAAEAALDFGNWNLPLGTYGGRQFWTDQTILAKWRIQKNVVTGHYRLLDPDDVRHAWGTEAECEAKLSAVAAEKHLKPPTGKVVVALHGILRSRHQLQPMCDWLEKTGGYEVINFNYASSRCEIGEHAEALATVLSRYPDVTELNFVGHSMGNIVLRHYLHDCATGAHGLKPDPRIRRIVMLGPPNNGAELAKRFHDNKLFQVVWGKSGQQLADKWVKLEPNLATPTCEFGIVAGCQGTSIGLNPLVTGDDDGVVSVDETKLPGACDFLEVPLTHGALMDDRQVRQCLLNFFKEGYFVSADKRQPLTPTATARRERPDGR
jgi:pimeloyl-ACP methyl ester carboxylesterase